MTPRTRARTRRAAVGLMVLAAAGSFTLAGCDPRTLAYFLNADQPEIPAPGPSLKGKKVVIVTTTAPSAMNEYTSVDREINREVIRLVRERVQKAEVVNNEKVYKWVEAHPTWTDATEIIKAFEADIVVHFELQSFSVQDIRSPQMLEGNSEVNIRVTEYGHPKSTKGKVNTALPKEATKVYEELWKSTFPKNAPVSEDVVSRTSFKSKFVKLVSTELSWQFLGHNNGDDIQDTRFGTR
jgi:ABC-type uncharacterized transport system auxiliary subunit